MSFNLSEKVALVAGGAGYLGTPVVEALAEQGARVMIADLDLPRAERVAATICRGSKRSAACQLDGGSESSIREAVQLTVREFGRLDILVNMTYRSIGKRLDELTVAEFDEANHVNLTCAFVFAREAASVMAEGGSIIMFTSMYGQVAPDPRIYQPPMNPNPIEYGVGKAGVIQMTKYLAVFLAPRGIRVNAIAPGPFPSPAVQQSDPDFLQRLAGRVPLGRVGKNNEVTGAVVLLAATEGSFITGETININGGWTAW